MVNNINVNSLHQYIEKQIYTADDVFNNLNDNLYEYQVVSNDQESYEQCTAIFNALVEAELLKHPDQIKKEVHSILKPGMTVIAQFSEDS